MEALNVASISKEDYFKKITKRSFCNFSKEDYFSKQQRDCFCNLIHNGNYEYHKYNKGSTDQPLTTVFFFSKRNRLCPFCISFYQTTVQSNWHTDSLSLSESGNSFKTQSHMGSIGWKNSTPTFLQ